MGELKVGVATVHAIVELVAGVVAARLLAPGSPAPYQEQFPSFRRRLGLLTPW